ncbi:MAG: DUF2059 domain-containing protein [Aliishimia sp.]
MHRFVRSQLLTTISLTFAVLWLSVTSALAAADRAKIEEFLNVTGFDVALESIRLSAGAAPNMLGIEADDFGSEWTRLSNDVFKSELMHDLAIDILAQTLSDDLLDHANTFYRSDLGQRLVDAENSSHMVEDEVGKDEAGAAIISGLVQHSSPRLEELKRMTRASDSAGTAIRAIQEIQVRFLMAAAGAGVVELRMDETDLRAMLATQEDELRLSIQSNALSGASYTYQAFSDDEVVAYADALEHPKMREVYDLMNAVQYEVMANRFEALAAAMARLQPSTDL